MKTTIQEVLLIAYTSFSKRQLCEIKTRSKDRNLSSIHRLELACCNGMLYEMLPEIIPAIKSGEKLNLWSIETKRFFLRILTGTQPAYITKESSLDPHIFLSKYRMS